MRRNLRDRRIACLKQSSTVLHPASGQIRVHRLTNKLSKSIGESRSSETYPAAEFSKRPRVLWPLMNKLKGLADVRVVDRPEPSAFARFDGPNPTAQNLDEDHLGNAREYRLLTGSLCRRFQH